ncbi:MAG: hypothetical protein JXA14_18555 [Anaerolineae bacterium]|nr:hypothetical protein [Anaerolineae bacterium]
MWIIADYMPTSLFSLRPYTATTSGGKSLIVPTPFAIKMALLDVAIRARGLQHGQVLFPTLRDLQVAARLPQHIVVNNTFTKILRLKEIKSKASEKGAAMGWAMAARQWPYQTTIAFREYVHFGGSLSLAFRGIDPETLAPLLVQVNYLGKRGGFMQLQSAPHVREELPVGFTLLTQGFESTFPLGMLQMVDDCGPSLTFDRADIYKPGVKIRPNKDRIFHHVVLPYQLVRSSKSYTLYERIAD